MSAARDFITHHRQGDMAVVKGMHEPRPSINGDWHGTCRHSARTRSRGPLDGVGKTPSPGLLAGARRACRQLVLRLHAGALPTPSGSLTKALVRSASDSPLEERGFELVWGFSCQVVVFGCLSVLCSEREGRSSSRCYDQVRGARGRGQGTETLAKLGGLPLSGACVSQRLDA
jgi:hypothetical protein